MNISSTNLCRLAAACCLTTAIAHGALAQPATPAIPPLQPMADPMTWQFLPVQNISPAMFAWWVDPDHNVGPAVPPDVGHAYDSEDTADPGQLVRLQAPRSASASAAGPPPRRARPFSLPQGVECITPSLQKHGVLAYGTAAGIQQLQKILGYIDKPLKFVEIDAKLIEVDHDSVAAFGMDFASSKGPFVFSTTSPASVATDAAAVGYSRNNWPAQLAALVAAHKATVLADTQLTTVNNRTAEAQSSNSAMEAGAQGSYAGYVTVKDTLAFTPTVNNDDTITMVMNIKHTRLFYDDASGPSVRNSSEMTTTANVKDGDTIALGGLRDRAYITDTTVPEDGKAHPGDRDIIAFVTVQVVKPAQ